MDYEEFKESILGKLKAVYGKSAEISINPVLKNNGKKYDGVYICLEGKLWDSIPVIYIEGYYEAYKGGMSMEECVNAIVDVREQNESQTDIVEFASRILDWDAIKNSVYPVLLSVDANQELLEEVISTKLLDLAIVYIAREKMATGGFGSVKINNRLFESYGISEDQLHEQAIHNLEQDGYTFLDMEQFVFDLLEMDEIMELNRENVRELQEGKMYILRNESGLYGAAGILNKKFLKEFLGDKNCYILPSSIHETIFIPAISDENQKELDDMVAEISVTQVRVEERLSNHSYYYDAQKEEIRISA